GLLLHALPLPGALGVAESFYALVFRASGVPGDVAVSAALLDRLISFWYTALLSMAGVLWIGLKLRATIDAAS
ncbi:MAG: flippase-like domain-containing protein, partial [Hadesarchaea archaeon]|nr:flippase-like domain-containing protein [Hadesarchaea archaeon]